MGSSFDIGSSSSGCSFFHLYLVNVIIIKGVLIVRFTKELEPVGTVEVRKIIDAGGNGGKPVIKDNVKLGCDGSS